VNCKVIYGGFNPLWQAAILEKQIVDDLVQNLEITHPFIKKMVVVTSWHEPSTLIEEINLYQPSLTVLCSFTDPLGSIENLLDKLPGEVIIVGYVEGDYFFDFWATACHKFFKKYTNAELEPTNFKYLYLNYNRKPHRHRTDFVKCLEENNLIDIGCVTLGNSKYSVDDNILDYISYGANDVVGDVGIPNDIYSLGKMEIWNSSFINVVSETQYEFSKNVFLSEKIYKPILGLRPFIINGSPGIYRILKRYGFDCFEDLFPVAKLEKETNEGYKFLNHDIICNCLNSYKNYNLMEIYNQIKPRLLYNQNLFYEHARNQRIGSFNTNL
jgi:hypothetical protein